jgi:hypothetical protein
MGKIGKILKSNITESPAQIDVLSARPGRIRPIRFQFRGSPNLQSTDCNDRQHGNPNERDASKGQLRRPALLNASFQVLVDQLHHVIAASRNCDSDVKVMSTNGTFLPVHEKAEIQAGIHSRTALRDCPVPREILEQIVAELETIDADVLPSKSYSTKELYRLLAGEFNVRNAESP